MTNSKFFGSRQILAVNKVGDALIPRSGQFPSFSQLGCVSQVDRLLENMPPSDRDDLKLLLTLLSFFPVVGLRLILTLLEIAWEKEWPVPGVLLLIRIGLRGVVMSLYYGDEKVHQLLGYKVGVYLES